MTSANPDIREAGNPKHCVRARRWGQPISSCWGPKSIATRRAAVADDWPSPRPSIDPRNRSSGCSNSPSPRLSTSLPPTRGNKVTQLSLFLVPPAPNLGGKMGSQEKSLYDCKPGVARNNFFDLCSSLKWAIRFRDLPIAVVPGVLPPTLRAILLGSTPGPSGSASSPFVSAARLFPTRAVVLLR